MPLETTLSDITERLRQGRFPNEQAISQCIVLRVLQRLYHGRIFDPACGPGSMFVQSARFVAEDNKNPAAERSIHCVEKTDETGPLRRIGLS